MYHITFVEKIVVRSFFSFLRGRKIFVADFTRKKEEEKINKIRNKGTLSIFRERERE